MRANPSVTLLGVLFAAVPQLRADDGKALDQLRAMGAPAAAPPAAAALPAAAPAIVDPTVELTPSEASFAGSAESVRIELLKTALPKVQDLIQAINTGSSQIVIDRRSGRPVPLRPGVDKNADLIKTLRAAQQYLNVKPDSMDYLNDKSAEKTLDTLEKAARLMSENLGKLLPRRKMLSPDGNTVAKNEGNRVVLYPDFWVANQAPYPSPKCAGVILTHEYFHHLIVNPKEAAETPMKARRVFHGEPASGAPTFNPESVEYALSDAYSLTSFTVQLALDAPLECVPNWKPGT